MRDSSSTEEFSKDVNGHDNNSNNNNEDLNRQSHQHLADAGHNLQQLEVVASTSTNTNRSGKFQNIIIRHKLNEFQHIFKNHRFTYFFN